MKYRAVIFDLYGTLIVNIMNNNNSLREMAAVVSAPEADFVRLWNADFDKRMTDKAYQYPDSLKNICRQLKLQLRKKQIEGAAKIRLEIVRQALNNPQPHAIETIAQLKTEGHKIALLSNCSTEETMAWDETPFTNIFDVTVYSCSVGLMKPDPRIFYLAVEKLKVKANECLYIADGMDGELKAATTAGMTAARIRFPHANHDDPYLEEWHGTTITSLEQVLDLVEQKPR
jgi:putative hydrolase of the HAD superfamily